MRDYSRIRTWFQEQSTTRNRIKELEKEVAEWEAKAQAQEEIAKCLKEYITDLEKLRTMLQQLQKDTK